MALGERVLDLAAALVELQDGLGLSSTLAREGLRAAFVRSALRLHLLDEPAVEGRCRVNRLDPVQHVVQIRRAEDGVDRRRVIRLEEGDEPRLRTLFGDAIAVARPPEQHLVARFLLP